MEEKDNKYVEKITGLAKCVGENYIENVIGLDAAVHKWTKEGSVPEDHVRKTLVDVLDKSGSLHQEERAYGILSGILQGLGFNYDSALGNYTI